MLIGDVQFFYEKGLAIAKATAYLFLHREDPDSYLKLMDAFALYDHWNHYCSQQEFNKALSSVHLMSWDYMFPVCVDIICAEEHRTQETIDEMIHNQEKCRIFYKNYCEWLSSKLTQEGRVFSSEVKSEVKSLLSWCDILEERHNGR